MANSFGLNYLKSIPQFLKRPNLDKKISLQNKLQNKKLRLILILDNVWEIGSNQLQVLDTKVKFGITFLTVLFHF